MSTLKVDGIRSNSASSDAITLASDGTCTANITNNLSNRNLIINGAMLVAQRSASSTSGGYQTVDRFNSSYANTGNTVTQAQVDVASGTTPYTLGFRKALKISMSGAGTVNTNSYIESLQKIEARNVATSGWNYLSSSSNITISFWVKVSTNQTFYVRLFSADTTNKTYCFSYTASGNNTWTKITKTIPGDSNLLFNTDGGEGLRVQFYQFYGTDYTGTRNLDTWEAAGSPHTPNQATTWYTAGASTWEMTGLQVEVGSVATDFEHRSFAIERRLCQRYYQKYTNPKLRGVRGSNNDDAHRMGMPLLVEMRADPSISWSGTQNVFDGNATPSITGISSAYPDPANVEFDATLSGTFTNGAGSAICAYSAGNEGTLMLNAEL